MQIVTIATFHITAYYIKNGKEDMLDFVLTLIINEIYKFF